MLVDLHMHSYYSDGSFSPCEVVELAKQKGLGFISITDHNTIEAHEEFELACSINSSNVVATSNPFSSNNVLL